MHSDYWSLRPRCVYELFAGCIYCHVRRWLEHHRSSMLSPRALKSADVQYFHTLTGLVLIKLCVHLRNITQVGFGCCDYGAAGIGYSWETYGIESNKSWPNSANVSFYVLCVFTERYQGTVPVGPCVQPLQPAWERLLWYSICGPGETEGTTHRIHKYTHDCNYAFLLSVINLIDGSLL